MTRRLKRGCYEIKPTDAVEKKFSKKIVFLR